MPAIQTPPRLVEPWGRGRGRDISREVGALGEERGVRGISGREGGRGVWRGKGERDCTEGRKGGVWCQDMGEGGDLVRKRDRVREGIRVTSGRTLG